MAQKGHSHETNFVDPCWPQWRRGADRIGHLAARADRCDDIAKELQNNIEGLKVNFTAAGIVYLTPTKELTLGCRAKFQRALCQGRQPHAETGFYSWSPAPRRSSLP